MIMSECKTDQNNNAESDRRSMDDVLHQKSDRALVVDDDPIIGQVVSEALTRLGFAVDAVESPIEAIGIYKQHHHDLVVSDWKMPEMNGIELVALFKQSDPQLAAILMTGYGSTETVIDAFTRGKINYYLDKPFKIQQLLEVASAALKERRLALSEREFRERLEEEIQQATRVLEQKNLQLEEKNRETEELYKQLQARQEEVEATKKYLEDILESSVDAIITTDNDWMIGFFSRGGEEMFGYASEKIIGRPLAELFPPDGDEHAALIHQLKSSKRIKHFETSMVKEDGQSMVVDISASVLHRDYGDEGFLLIIKDIEQRKRLEEELKASNIYLEKLSITDGLTRLFNHRYFQKCLAEEFQRAQRYNTSLSMIMLDLDDFKLVNDTFGHQVGDQVLILLADLIRETVREVDTPARYGGEEFAIILPQTNVDSAIRVAERIKTAVEYSPRFQEIAPTLRVTASLGLCGFPDPDIKNALDLIRFADKALYRAKNIGKNRVVIGSSSGLKPLGRGERLTPGEKKMILRRVTNTLRGTLNLDQVMDVLLSEVSEAAREDDAPPPCSIMLMDSSRGLQPQAERNDGRQRTGDFDIAAHLALEKRAVQVFDEHEEHGPASSFPIMIAWPDKGEEVVGVINIGSVPADLEFFRDLTNQAALGILNAKLHHEVEAARDALERRVNQLMSLSLMGMGLQRNALTYEDYEQENVKLLARSLARIGFEKIWVHQYDPEEKQLHQGVDASLRGDGAPKRIPLEKLNSKGLLMKTLSARVEQHLPSVLAGPVSGLSDKDLKALKGLALKDRDLAVAQLVQADKVIGLVSASKKGFQKEDGEALSMFVLHASLIMENLSLSRLYQDRNRRLTMIYEMGLNLASAITPASLADAARQVLTDLTEILQAAEISVYLYSSRNEALRLLAYASDSAHPGHEPGEMLYLRDCQVMGPVIERTLTTGLTDPVVLNDLKARLGRKMRKRYATGSYMGIPLVNGGEVLGIMNVTDKMDRSAFSPKDAELAQITAGMLASALGGSFLIKRLEDRAMDAAKYLAGMFNSRPEPGLVADVAVVVTELMGLGPNMSERVVRDVWIGALPELPEGRKAGWSVQILGQWLESLEPAVPPGQDSAQIQKEKAAHAALTADIIDVAKSFTSRYLAVKPKQRPSLDQALTDMLAEEGTARPPEVLAALLRGLIEGRLRRGRRRVILKEEEAAELKQNLNRTARRTKDPAAPLAGALLKVLTG